MLIKKTQGYSGDTPAVEEGVGLRGGAEMMTMNAV